MWQGILCLLVQRPQEEMRTKLPLQNMRQSHPKGKNSDIIVIIIIVWTTSSIKVSFLQMNLSKHLKRHQSTKEQASCTICGRVVLKERLRLHMTTHLPDHEKKHVCPLCGKGFTTMKDIKKHMNSKTLHRS